MNLTYEIKQYYSIYDKDVKAFCIENTKEYVTLREHIKQAGVK